MKDCGSAKLGAIRKHHKQNKKLMDLNIINIIKGVRKCFS